ncbi:hydrolethalus syndrome protein 1 isoform X1 [Anguilla anguilla]|uniref:hydrolethalus syndrome protein 1 isoform X1 n=2 Tax=Anguilla anguilla TaxID=7936 RepID=UPI0015ABF6EE|nr:hydrolethalus syndrome protein 1 isoform X1 [Anguilla anguilla]
MEMETIDFSEDEIERQLAVLGYTNIRKHRLHEFKRDLDQLIQHERSNSHSLSDVNSPSSQSRVSRNSSNGLAVVREKLQTQKKPEFSFGVSWPRASLQERPVHSVYAADNFSERPEQYESYTRYSVSAKCPRTSAAPHSLQEENDPENISSSFLDTSKSSSPHTMFGAAGKPFIKRKVLRKQSGQLHVCDESMRNEDSVDRLEDQLERLRVSVTASESEHLDCEEMDSLSEATNAFQTYSNAMSRSRSENDIQAYPKSFIRPLSAHPHTRNLKKTDPVAKYFQYKQDWETFRAPGEKDRKGLRSEIREQMMYESKPSRKLQKIYIPNTYVVPTEKKRSALRWEVRHDLANGILPQRVFQPL